MTGRDLVRWIIEHDALDMECVVRYRDGGGSYRGGEVVVQPVLASYEGVHGNPHDVCIDYKVGSNPNCLVI